MHVYVADANTRLPPSEFFQYRFIFQFIYQVETLILHEKFWYKVVVVKHQAITILHYHSVRRNPLDLTNSLKYPKFVSRVCHA